jgi:ferredoxin-NADP reductase
VNLTLRSRRHLTGNIWSFIFDPDTPLTWTAGQFIRVNLPHPRPDDEGTMRHFTVSSAPYEQHIEIVTRLTGTTFKQALDQLRPRDTMALISLPAGDFIWQPSPRPLVFVAQGIGVTPFRSILRQRHHDGLPLSAHLFHTNSSPDIPFEQELAGLSRSSELTITYLKEPVTPELLAQTLPDLSTSTIYVSGPRSFISLLTAPYNLPAGQLKQDFFPGYTSSTY